MNKKTMMRRMEAIGESRNVYRKALTKKQAEIMDFVKMHAKRYGFPPTRAEISEAFGFASHNAAHAHLVLIARKGHIKMQHAARGIVLTEVEDAE